METMTAKEPRTPKRQETPSAFLQTSKYFIFFSYLSQHKVTWHLANVYQGTPLTTKFRYKKRSGPPPPLFAKTTCIWYHYRVYQLNPKGYFVPSGSDYRVRLTDDICREWRWWAGTGTPSERCTSVPRSEPTANITVGSYRGYTVVLKMWKVRTF